MSRLWRLGQKAENDPVFPSDTKLYRWFVPLCFVLLRSGPFNLAVFGTWHKWYAGWNAPV